MFPGGVPVIFLGQANLEIILESPKEKLRNTYCTQAVYLVVDMM